MIQKSCSEYSVLNVRDVALTASFLVKIKPVTFVIRFKSENLKGHESLYCTIAERIRCRYMADLTGSDRISATLGS